MIREKWAVAAAALFLAAGCARMPAPMARPRLVPPDAGWVTRTLRKMTLEEKIGQMIAVRFTGAFRNADSEYLRDLESLIVKTKIGGLILSGGEVYETAELTNAFQKLAKVPLLFASDLERGAGTQLTNATLFPPLMSLGASGSEEQAYEMGRITALEGRAVGIHMTYAPVVDVNINPDNPIINTRSVGEDPALVSRIARAFIRGCQENGMIATAKHFPGHGDTAQDSHLLLPTITAGLDRLERVELAPFKDAVNAGVRAVMTSHLFVPALDPTPNLPATLSPAILTGVLRKKLGFRGLIVTDAMEMAGITNSFSPGDAALRAVLAGADIVLLPPEPARVAEYLAAAGRDGKIPAQRIDESVRRILEAKAGLGLDRNRFVRIEDIRRKVAPRPFLDQAYQTFESAVTLVKNEGDLIPLTGADRKIAVFSLSSDQGDYFAGRAFVAEMKKRDPGILGFFADGDTGQDELDADVARSAGVDTVVFALFSRLTSSKGSVDLEPKHAALVQKLAAAGGPAVVAVSFGSPYFLQHFPGVAAYVCVYRNTPETQQIAARALFGEMDINGKLPVSLPGLYPIGHGIPLKKTSK
ncbi:MAG: glycoside hydrolase family 3 N-terminal domain-containing protein [Candidatus Aminicenantales bacterium]|jgi:beta-N-acetylhexosaminidase